jgi:phosphoribosylformimino-5-aminoimidazole carboxamide ribotide isomerase
MIIYPAIDLKGGRCVRLEQGRADAATTYDEDPGRVAHRFAEVGAEWIHCVDLDGAFSGEPKNWLGVERILHAGVRVQLGGGIRDEEAVERILDAGVARVVLGTRASEDEAFMRRVVALHGDRVAVGIDAKDGFVAVRGWVETTRQSATDLALRMVDAGVSILIYTDIATDGMMTGPNLEALEGMLSTVTCGVIASGGVSRLEDIEALAALGAAHKNLIGVITGKALYEQKLVLADAIRVTGR